LKVKGKVKVKVKVQVKEKIGGEMVHDGFYTCKLQLIFGHTYIAYYHTY
jgi:hypothetical protein